MASESKNESTLQDFLEKIVPRHSETLYSIKWAILLFHLSLIGYTERNPAQRELFIKQYFNHLIDSRGFLPRSEKNFYKRFKRQSMPDQRKAKKVL